MDKQIVLYGAPWCSDCRRSRVFLDENKVEYEYVDIDQDEKGADKVVQINKGLRSIPTIVFPDGAVLVEPSNEQLKEKLKLD